MPKPMRSMKTVRKTTRRDGLRVMGARSAGCGLRNESCAIQRWSGQTRAEHREEGRRVKLAGAKTALARETLGKKSSHGFFSANRPELRAKATRAMWFVAVIFFAVSSYSLMPS